MVAIHCGIEANPQVCPNISEITFGNQYSYGAFTAR